MNDNINWNHADSLNVKFKNQLKEPFNLDKYIENKVKECIERYMKEEKQNDGNK